MALPTNFPIHNTQHVILEAALELANIAKSNPLEFEYNGSVFTLEVPEGINTIQQALEHMLSGEYKDFSIVAHYETESDRDNLHAMTYKYITDNELFTLMKNKSKDALHKVKMHLGKHAELYAGSTFIFTVTYLLGRNAVDEKWREKAKNRGLLGRIKQDGLVAASVVGIEMLVNSCRDYRRNYLLDNDAAE